MVSNEMVEKGKVRKPLKPGVEKSITVSLGDHCYDIEVLKKVCRDVYKLKIAGKEVTARVKKIEKGSRIIVDLDGRKYKIDIVNKKLLINSVPITVKIVEKIRRSVSTASSVKSRLFKKVAHFASRTRKRGEFRAPISGRVVEVLVEKGKNVNKGDVLLVLESMKMLNQLTSPYTGVVTEVLVSPGSVVRKGDLMIVISKERQ